MKRTRAAVSLVIAIALAAGCAGSDDSSSATPSVPTDTAAASASTVPETATSVPPTEPDNSATTTTAGVVTTTPSTTAVPTTTVPPVDRYPDQPDGVSWPTDEWAIGEPPSGLDVGAIDAAVDAAFGAADAGARLRSFVAVQGGQIVYERYHPLDGPDTVFDSFSVAKSVTSTLVGMLVDDGVLDVAAPAPVEEWADPADPRSAITLEHLLQMRSGLDWDEVYEPGSPPLEMLGSSDWAAYVIDRPLESEPGSLFEYSTGTTAVLAEIVADQLGGPDALDDFIETDLLTPLGIESTELLEDPSGQFAGGLGFNSTTRDFARFGLMMLRGGEWDGAQIVSSDWVDAATTPSPALSEYGYQWWLDEDDEWFAARGLFGQLILIAPGLDLVIAANTTSGGDSETPAMIALDAFTAALG